MIISNDFIFDLAAHRDDLYARALAIVSADPHAAGLSPAARYIRAEVVLHSAVRETFGQCEKDSHLNPFQEVQQHLPEIETQKSGGGKIENQVMPADVWARLVAAIQVEAARLAHSKAVNPDAVLLNPDPLLAPKKTVSPDDFEGLGLLPEYRFFLVGIIAILIAIIFTIYLLTRPAPKATHVDAPETQSATVPDRGTGRQGDGETK
ncbi:MAG: hypothetical protein FWD61_04535 [Phycisphaerales bacterium]|nr:hypothetical protein [Phycisphaerales bacterium]